MIQVRRGRGLGEGTTSVATGPDSQPLDPSIKSEASEASASPPSSFSDYAIINAGFVQYEESFSMRPDARRWPGAEPGQS